MRIRLGFILMLVSAAPAPALAQDDGPVLFGAWTYRHALDSATGNNASFITSQYGDGVWVLGVGCVHGAYRVAARMVGPDAAEARQALVGEQWGRRVRWVVDDHGPVSQVWSPLADGLVLDSAPGAGALVGWMRTGRDSLHMQLMYSGGSDTLTWELAGAAEAIAALDRCRPFRSGSRAPPPPHWLGEPVIEGEVFLPDQVDELPTLTQIDEPRPPPGSPFNAIVGRVWFTFVVDVSGAVVPSSVAVVRTTNEQLTEPARRVLTEAEFTPGLIDGRAVPVLMEHAVSVAAEP